jgi:hypothetical protein
VLLPGAEHEHAKVEQPIERTRESHSPRRNAGQWATPPKRLEVSAQALNAAIGREIINIGDG